MPSLLDYFRPQSQPPNPFDPFNSRVTYYAPGPGDRMEGGFETSQPNPGTGRRIPSTLDDVRLGKSPFVTLASDPSRYGQTIKIGPQTYISPIDQKTYTLPDVTGYVHDTGSAFRGRPDKLDVATGDFRGWDPRAASALVTADAGNRTVTPLTSDEADQAMRPIGLPEPWRATGEGESPTDATAIASGPPQGRKMPMSLMDMFQPQNAAGQPVGFGDALASRSNSLIGLGLGLLQPSRPLAGESTYGNALQGYMGGASLDARQAAEAAKLAHQKTQEARQAALDKFNMNLQTQQFAENKLTEAEKLARASGLQPGTPEHAAFIKTAIQSKTEGDWTPQTDENTGQSYAYNKRTGETRAINVPGVTATAPVNPFPEPGASGGGTAPVYGYGQSGFSATPSAGAASGASGTAQPGQGPVAGKTMREARAKAVIANEEDAVKSARAAAEFKPALDEMTTAYEALAKAGGVGPISGSTIGRTVQAVTGYGGANESLRQRYDTAKGKVQALITAAQNKGEGAVSNYERQMFGAQFPPLNALDASTQLPFLRQLQAATDQSIATGRGTSLGPSPGTFTRPAVEQPPRSTGTRTGGAGVSAPPKPGFVKGGYVFKGGDPSDQSNWAPVR